MVHLLLLHKMAATKVIKMITGACWPGSQYYNYDNTSIKDQIRTQHYRGYFTTKVCQKEPNLNVILINFTWKYICFFQDIDAQKQSREKLFIFGGGKSQEIIPCHFKIAFHQETKSIEIFDSAETILHSIIRSLNRIK